MFKIFKFVRKHKRYKFKYFLDTNKYITSVHNSVSIKEDTFISKANITKEKLEQLQNLIIEHDRTYYSNADFFSTYDVEFKKDNEDCDFIITFSKVVYRDNPNQYACVCYTINERVLREFDFYKIKMVIPPKSIFSYNYDFDGVPDNESFMESL